MLDLHGEEAAFVNALLNEFVRDSHKMRHKYIKVIHGKSTNILTNEVHSVLRKHSLVASFGLNNWNLGETIIELKPLK